ncbi:MAG: hypothetical protein ABUL72_00280 [Armatimonadota bacterium]
MSAQPTPPSDQRLCDANFAEWLAFLTNAPGASEIASVGFYTTLWEAVTRANIEDKPILLWAMNGHPMACT